MALDPVVNFFRSEIATLPLASGGTSMVITTGDGNKLPNPAVDGAFNLTIYNASDPFVTPEIVRCTAKSGDTLTITRAQEGTTATNKTSGSTWYVELTPTAKTIQDIDSVKLDKAGGTMTGDLTIPDKIIHAGDTNTAIRFPANDTVAIETGGTERVRITDTNVGVNTTQGIGRFQVNNIGSATSFFSVVGGEAIVSGNSVTVSKTQRGILHIENNELQAVGKNASLTFGLGGSQFQSTYHHISGAIRVETTGSANTAINPKMVFSVLDGSSTLGTLVDRLEISHTGTVTGGKFAPTANTTAGNGMYLPTTNTVAIGTNGSEALRIDSNQNVSVANTSGTLKFNIQNTGIVGGTRRDPDASGTTVSIYTITCAATSDSTRYITANGTLKVAIGSRSSSANAVASYTLPFMLSRIGRSTGIVVLTQGTSTLLTSSTSSGVLAIDTVTVALSSSSNTGATLDITVTTSGTQSVTNLDFNTSIEVTQNSRYQAPFTIVPA